MKARFLFNRPSLSSLSQEALKIDRKTLSVGRGCHMLNEIRSVNPNRWEERTLEVLEKHFASLGIYGLFKASYFVQDLLGLGIGRRLELRLA
jgi:hypothetical protein